jgi:hypothetical protein
MFAVDWRIAATVEQVSYNCGKMQWTTSELRDRVARLDIMIVSARTIGV